MIPAGARERSERLVSSEYWWIWAVKPCFAAILRRLVEEERGLRVTRRRFLLVVCCLVVAEDGAIRHGRYGMVIVNNICVGDCWGLLGTVT